MRPAKAGGVPARVVWGIARHELAVSGRTALWWLVLPLMVTLGANDPALAGMLAAALAVSLPGRTVRAHASDIVETLPQAGTVALGRALAALVLATALVLVGVAANVGITVLVTTLDGGSLQPGVGSLGVVLLAVPAAWVGASLGLLAGRVVGERLAFLLVFLGGVGAAANVHLTPVLTPLGALDALGMNAGALPLPWPLTPLLLWHGVALGGVAIGLAAAGSGGPRRAGLGRWLFGLGVGGVLVGLGAYTLTLSGFAIRLHPRAVHWTQDWTVQRMAVTLDVGAHSTATATVLLANAGKTPLGSVDLHLPAGLHLQSAHLAAGGTLSPEPVLHLPVPVAAGGTTQLTLTYGGRWTAFGRGNTLARAAVPGHLVLMARPDGVLGWLPAPSAPQDTFPLTVRLTGAVPSAAFCTLPPVGPDTWAGTEDLQSPAGCLGQDMRLSRSGSAEVWTRDGGPAGHAQARSFGLVVGAVAGCLGVPAPHLGVMPAPLALNGQPWNPYGPTFGLRRSGDPTAVAPLYGQDASFLAWSVVPSLLWGQGTTPFSRTDPFLPSDLLQLVPAAAARWAGLPPTGPNAVVPVHIHLSAPATQGGSPGALAVQQALGHLSPQAGCALLAGLRRLDAHGQLTDAAITTAITRAEGRAG